MNTEKLNVKDMIHVGIFAAIIILIKTIIGFAGVIPLVCAILPVITAFFCGPVYLLFMSKTKKFGMITLLTSVIGLGFCLVGYGWPAFVGSVIVGLIADFVTKIGGYKKKKLITLGYCIFSQWGVTLFITIWTMGDAYFENLKQSMGVDFAEAFEKLVPWWSVFPLILLTALFALLGIFIGMKIMKKHFERNGAIDDWE